MTVLLNTHCARADIVNDIFRVECMPELGVLTISNFFDNGNLPDQVLKADPDGLGKKYGIYLYENNLIEIDNETFKQSPKTFETTCRLKTDDDIHSNKFETYYIKLVGNYGNESTEGQCGLWRSFMLTLSTKEKVILENISFDENCHSPRFIKNMNLYAHQGYIQIMGTRMMEPLLCPDQLHHKNPMTVSTIWIDEAPFSNDFFYPPLPEKLGVPEDMSKKPDCP